MLPFVPASTESSSVFMERCELTRMEVRYTVTVNKMLFDRRGAAWRERKFMRVRSET